MKKLMFLLCFLCCCEVAYAGSPYVFKDSNGKTLLTNVVDNNKPAGENFKKFEQPVKVTYYPSGEVSAGDEFKELKQLAKKPNAKIGMTKDQVLKHTNWGKPIDIHKTITKYGTTEQWVYESYQYLYFENGRLTTIQQ